VYCGDDQGAKNVAAKLIHDAGFDPVDAGSLRIARYTDRSRCLSANSPPAAKEDRSWRIGSSGLRNRMSHKKDMK
jgi:predicted dinucleotide-binding enzyme